MQNESASSRSLCTSHAPSNAEDMAVARKVVIITSHDQRGGVRRNDRRSSVDSS
jgi:hypothetical protein